MSNYNYEEAIEAIDEIYHYLPVEAKNAFVSINNDLLRDDVDISEIFALLVILTAFATALEEEDSDEARAVCYAINLYVYCVVAAIGVTIEHFQQYQLQQNQEKARRRHSYSIFGKINDTIASAGDWFRYTPVDRLENINAILWVMGACALLWATYKMWTAFDPLVGILVAIAGGMVAYYASKVVMAVLRFVLGLLFPLLAFVFLNIYTLIATLVVILCISSCE